MNSFDDLEDDNDDNEYYLGEWQDIDRLNKIEDFKEGDIVYFMDNHPKMTVLGFHEGKVVTFWKTMRNGKFIETLYDAFTPETIIHADKVALEYFPKQFSICLN